MTIDLTEQEVNFVVGDIKFQRITHNRERMFKTIQGIEFFAGTSPLWVIANGIRVGVISHPSGNMGGFYRFHLVHADNCQKLLSAKSRTWKDEYDSKVDLGCVDGRWYLTTPASYGHLEGNVLRRHEGIRQAVTDSSSMASWVTKWLFQDIETPGTKNMFDR